MTGVCRSMQVFPMWMSTRRPRSPLLARDLAMLSFGLCFLLFCTARLPPSLGPLVSVLSIAVPLQRKWHPAWSRVASLLTTLSPHDPNMHTTVPFAYLASHRYPYDSCFHTRIATSSFHIYTRLLIIALSIPSRSHLPYSPSHYLRPVYL